MQAEGLNSEEVKEKIKIYGKNEIKRTKKTNPLKIFLMQFISPLIVILIIASLISVLIGYLPGQEPDYIDAILILIIVFVSGFSSFVQEYKAEKSIEALQKISTPFVQAIRDNKVVEVMVTDITIGDIVLLEAGDIVPADGLIIDSFGIEINESILTGEAKTVNKKVGDELFMNTSVSTGSAKIKITQIGMQTKVGKIADKLQNIRDAKTTFEEEIEKFSKKIFWAAGIITFIIFVGNLIKYDLYTSLLTAVSLAVAAIPEGLPAVVVLSLALGAKTMYKNNALVRKLNVVESIGAIDIICSDKTGTITKNEMSVIGFYINHQVLSADMVEINKKDIKNLLPLIECGCVCSNVKTEGHPEGKRKYLGEQTEIGLIKAGEKFGLHSELLEKKYARVNEIPFSSDRKMMSVVVQNKEEGRADLRVYTKGAPEIVLKKCNKILIDGKIKKLTSDDKKQILDQNNNYAANALRVLGFAYKETKDISQSIEEDLIWIGLQAMEDPPHPEIESVLENCQTAGIRVIMITGDNAVTARAIAAKIGLESQDVLEGVDIDNINSKELEKKLNNGVNIFARTTPFHKLKILKILEKKNRVVMTGDGVNDALALKQAHVGVAMGVKGTTVAKEASDIVLMDDNFSTVVTAVKEGRRIFDNIRKFINYLLVSNFAEVSVLFLSTLFFSLEKPILMPAQILWINLLTDGLPALALGADPARKDIMKVCPRKKNEPLIDKKLGILIGAMGIKKTVVLLATFLVILPFGEDLARSTLFTGFILYEFVRIASIRYQEKLTWLSNPWLLMALFISLLLQFIILYTPLSAFFHVASLGLYEWGILLTGVVVGYVSAIAITRIVMKQIK